jgi:hypothetical protein
VGNNPLTHTDSTGLQVPLPDPTGISEAVGIGYVMGRGLRAAYDWISQRLAQKAQEEAVIKAGREYNAKQ